jgi:hypothetical protein
MQTHRLFARRLVIALALLSAAPSLLAAISINDNNTHVDRGVVYSNEPYLTASGGSAPYTFTGSSLPSGITLPRQPGRMRSQCQFEQWGSIERNAHFVGHVQLCCAFDVTQSQSLFYSDIGPEELSTIDVQARPRSVRRGGLTLQLRSVRGIRVELGYGYATSSNSFISRTFRASASAQL